MGTARIIWEKGSGGVIIAARTNMPTTAYGLLLFKIEESIISHFDKKTANIGNVNIRPEVMQRKNANDKKELIFQRLRRPGSEREARNHKVNLKRTK